MHPSYERLPIAVVAARASLRIWEIEVASFVAKEIVDEFAVRQNTVIHKAAYPQTSASTFRLTRLIPTIVGVLSTFVS